MSNAKQATTNSQTHANESATPIADKVSETLHLSVDNLAQHASMAEGKLRQSAAESAKTLGEKQNQAKKYWDNSAVGKYTKAHPVATAGIAFAAGMLVTSLLKKK
ncbi:DUF883 domain-containing protein [Paraglaciecola aestuariivivens]